MSWRIIYIEKGDYLSSYLDNLKIKCGLDETTIPFSDINSIIIDNRYTNISIGLISKCAEYKINLVICDYYHLPFALMLPYSNNYNSSGMHLKQLEWSNAEKMLIWKYIVMNKIKNQLRVLYLSGIHSSNIQIIERYIDEVELGDNTNREGLAAKIYFRELFGYEFSRQNEDVINWSLNYGYSLLRSQICRALVARGLDPHYGIFHRGATNPFNLADDAIEVFRPIIDLWVYRNVDLKTEFNHELRKQIIRISTFTISYGNNVTIINAINIYIDKLVYCFNTGDITNLTFPDVEYHE